MGESCEKEGRNIRNKITVRDSSAETRSLAAQALMEKRTSMGKYKILIKRP